MSDIILGIRNLKKSYCPGGKKLEILRNINFELRRGEWVCLLGSSGSGKTTLLNLAGYLETPDSGTLEFDGVNFNEISDPALFRNRKLGFVFQNYSLLPELSVLENIMLPGMFSGKFSRRALSLRAQELLEAVGLTDRASHRPGELSGGEQQRGAIARALINRPELLLADEPTGNLDEETGESVMELFRRLRESEKGLSIFMITHNPEIAAQADRCVHLQHGELI